jgi:hypothetical protein
MSIGLDIKKAFESVGTAYTIQHEGSSDQSGEFCVYELSQTLQRPFDREFVYSASLSYDSLAVEGDVLKFDDGRHFLLTNKSPEQFNNESIIYETKLLKCNIVSGEVLRPSGELWDSQNYHKIPVWSLAKGTVSAILVEVYGGSLDERTDFGEVTLNKLELYVSDQIGLQVMDRFQPVSGEYYKVDFLKNRIYPGITLAEVSEDTRE